MIQILIADFDTGYFHLPSNWCFVYTNTDINNNLMKMI